MFETLFTYPRVLRRHREGPLAEERAAYLTELTARCVAPATLIKQARCSTVKSHFPEHEPPAKGRGPHGLRHACARHLLESGLSFKQVGDHLGHRDPDTTRIYAKVNLTMLRRVAFDDLGGLQ